MSKNKKLNYLKYKQPINWNKTRCHFYSNKNINNTPRQGNIREDKLTKLFTLLSDESSAFASEPVVQLAAINLQPRTRSPSLRFPNSWLLSLFFIYIFIPMILGKLTKEDLEFMNWMNAINGYSNIFEDINQLPSISDLVKYKMIVDPELSQESFSTLQCNKIVDNIEKTTEILPVSKRRIESVLLNPELAIICTTQKRINEILLYRGGGSAFFEPSTTSLYLSALEANEGLINHEFIHMDNFFRHKTVYCYANNLDATAPIFPLNAKKMRNYAEALDKGDKRILNFNDLWFKHKQKIKLSSEDQKKLESYKSAAKNCLKPIIEDMNKPGTYEQLLKLGWQPNSEGFHLTQNFTTMEILSVKTTPQADYVYLRPVEIEVAIFNILDKIEKKLNGKLSRLSQKEKFIERDAYTFEHLSEEAINVFYPEAKQLQSEDIDQCPPSFNLT